MREEQYRAYRQWIESRSEAFVADIGALIAIPSYNSQTGGIGDGAKAVLEKVLEMGARFGLYCERLGEPFCRVSLREGPADIGLFAHGDVVSPGEGWSTPPFTPVLQDGWLYGRGATDNKGQLVCLLYVLAFLRESGSLPDCNVALFVGTAEETTMEDTKWFLAHCATPQLSLVPDGGYSVGYTERGRAILTLSMQDRLSPFFVRLEAGCELNRYPSSAVAVLNPAALSPALSTDPADWAKRFPLSTGARIAAENGLLVVTVPGKSGHASRTCAPGDNAIHLLADYLTDLPGLNGRDKAAFRYIRALAETGDGAAFGIPAPQEGMLSCVLSKLTFEAGVPTLGFDLRWPASADEAQLFAAVAASASANGFSYSVQQTCQPSYLSPELPQVKLLTDVYNAAAHWAGRPQRTPYAPTGGSYAGRIPNALLFGMEAGRNAHGADEAVCLDSLYFGFAAYLLALQALGTLQAS